jgi:hypothetical protein
MARMAPNVLAPDAPDSERRIFALLRDDPGTRDWTVLHSLGLSSAYSGVYGEIDFVAVVPGRGLLCVEVKGGRVSCQGGVWTTTNRAGQTSAYARSPFQQAREGMFKLLAALKTRFGARSAEARCPLGWIVIFTDTASPPLSPDFLRQELIDSQDLLTSPVARLRDCISLQQSVERFSAPAPQTLASVAQFLRPDFDRVPTLSTSLWDAEQRIVALTEEQYDVLDHVADNEYSVVHGGAGTGKTMLAVEMARRLASQGRSVLLTCYNRELGMWLEARTINFGPGIVVSGHLHRLLRSRIGTSELRDDIPADDVFDHRWYELGALAIAAGPERFDTILVDEAQDFPAAPLLDVLDAWLEPADVRPKAVLFADYSRQALYGSPAGAREVLRKRLQPANFALRRNCRNTRKITAETELLTGSFEVKVSERQPIGTAVERFFYGDAREHQRAIDRALQRLRAEGFRAEDIVILGPRRRENSVLAGLESCGGFRIVDRQDREGAAQVIYSTVQAFKGLESPAVLMVELPPESGGQSDSLLYVGMTRARTRLMMVLPESAREEIARRERDNFAKSQLGGA